MSIRSISSATLSFGLVSVPVKIYPSASAETVSLCMVTPAGNKVKQKYVDYYLGPNKGGDKSYYLLSQVMKKQGKIAVAQWSNRGREHLVLVRPYEGGLVMHQMFYANEVRDFGEVPAAKAQVMEAEEKVACMLVEALATKTFEPQKYEDNYAKRVKEAVAKKQEGLAIDTPVKAQAPTTDLLAALKASIEAAVKRT